MRFRDEYYFLSNMYNCKMVVNGITYSSLESAFQSFKTKDLELRKSFSGLNGFESKKLGRKIELRSDWNDVKLPLMEALIKNKFKDNTYLGNKLKSVTCEIVEDNTWNDTFWGKCNGKGKNWLGIILSDRRNELNR